MNNPSVDNLSVAFKRGTGFYSTGIRAVTGGEFSHVELVFDTVDGQSLCYSSREPDGTGFKKLDLTDSKIWEVLPLPEKLQADTYWEAAYYYALGSSGRPYDFIGIAGILEDLKDLHVGCARFCSNEVVQVLRCALGMFLGVNPRLVAPDWRKETGDGRVGLYQLMRGLVTAEVQPTVAAAGGGA